MKLLYKFSAIFALVFGGGLIVAALLSYRFLQDNARDQVLDQAQLMMQSMHAARSYTTSQIKPLLETLQVHQRSFLAQTVPAYAATENFGYLRKTYPDYEYKEATLNPTNLRDRAVDWEADIVNDLPQPSRADAVNRRTSGRYRPVAVPGDAYPCRSVVPAMPFNLPRKKLLPSLIRHYGPK